MYHVPVLLHETVEGLNIKPDGIYVDVTFGGGGHSKEILKHLGPKGHLYGFDQDLDALENALDDERFTFVRSNFKYLSNFMAYYGVEKVDGILADLGVSSHHFDDEERGFSFRFDAHLDMRMNKRATHTASEVLNTYSEEALAGVLFYYGEFRQSRKLAHRLVEYRTIAPFDTVEDFVAKMSPLFPKERQKKEMAKLFQALRIEVNQELEVLRSFLFQVPGLLNVGGRLSVLTYHSLEDRLVKNFIKTGNVEGTPQKDFYGNVLSPLSAVNRKVVIANEEELERNPRARSAKLRIAELKEELKKN